MKTYNYKIGNSLLEDVVDFSLFKDKKNILVQIFCGQNAKTLQYVSNKILEEIPNAICIGTTTDGEIFNKKITTHKTIISISIFDNTTIKTSYVQRGDSFNNGIKLAKSLITSSTKLLILFTDGTRTNGEDFLKGIESFDNNVKICGGMAGDNGLFTQTYVSSQNKILSDGAVGVSLNSSDLHIYTDYKFDWTPIGLEHTIDKIEGNRIYSISGMSPVEFYKKYLGVENLTQTEFPLIVEKNGIPTARAVLAKHDDGSLSCGGNLKQGDKVKLGFGDAEALMSNPLYSFNNSFEYNIETFYIYSCMARRRYMRDLIKLETQPFASIAPTAGFFTYAEFFHKEGHNELLNQTLTIVALSESNKKDNFQNIKPKKAPKSNKDNSYARTIQSLTHLIQQSAKDYQEQSKKLNDEKIYSQHLLDSQKQFLKHAVHETNTPLSVIISNIELYEMENGKNRYLTNIEVALKNLFSIYDDLSYLVKKDQIAYPKYKIDLADYIRSRVDFFEQVARKANSKFIFESAEIEMSIVFNESKLQRIIDNNLTNAIKYTYEHEDIFISLQKEKSFYKFIVSSHSKKIQHPEKIFKEYYREEKSQDGFGLGLNLVKRICDEEDVKIHLESNETFTSFTYLFKG